MQSELTNRIKVIGLLCCILFLSHKGSEACDTWVALRDATRSGYVILAKNSDRPLFDCQPLMLYPRQKWAPGTIIDLGRISIPQVSETYATMGSSPYWCWGYEEGINEYSVAIGNEGIFTRVLAEDIEAFQAGKGPELGPTGMDLLRLGLERGKTAREALDIITDLVEEYGQFGSGTPTQIEEGAYHNSYIIADPEEAWILETAGTKWAARRIGSGVASISNTLSIGTEWDLASQDLMSYAITKGWWSEDQKGEFNFTQAYLSDALRIRMQTRRAQIRADCSVGLLKENQGDVDPRWMKRIARDRSSNPSIDLDQTASSCVAVLPHSGEELPIFWWCASVPSNSCYIPFFIHGTELPEIISRAGSFGKSIVPPSKVKQDTFSEDSFWWLFKELSDLVSVKREERNPVVRDTFDHLEEEFETGIPDLMKDVMALRRSGEMEEAGVILDKYTAECVHKVISAVEVLKKRFQEEARAGEEDWSAYLGPYTANFGPFQNTEFTVLDRNGILAVDIPGQMTFDLKEPDEDGFRVFVMTPNAGVSFDTDEKGRVSLMRMHQITPAQKQETPDSLLHGVSEEYKSFVGKYAFPMANQEIIVQARNERLGLILPDGGLPELKPPDKKGNWSFTDTDLVSVSFAKDDEGAVQSMRFHQIFLIPRGKSIASVLEKSLEESGVEKTLELFHDIKKNRLDEYVISERSLNVFGYKLLNAKKVVEAIAIFKLNADLYPDSYNVYDSLGEAYMIGGETESAIQFYRKSLELNPENENARDKLEKLESGR